MENPSSWANETMLLINKLTPEIKGKAFDPDWFVLRQRIEDASRVMEDKAAILKQIYAVATGEDQVCNSDTEALEHIAECIRTKAQNAEVSDRRGGGSLD